MPGVLEIHGKSELRPCFPCAKIGNPLKSMGFDFMGFPILAQGSLSYIWDFPLS